MPPLEDGAILIRGARQNNHTVYALDATTVDLCLARRFYEACVLVMQRGIRGLA